MDCVHSVCREAGSPSPGCCGTAHVASSRSPERPSVTRGPAHLCLFLAQLHTHLPLSPGLRQAASSGRWWAMSLSRSSGPDRIPCACQLRPMCGPEASPSSFSFSETRTRWLSHFYLDKPREERTMNRDGGRGAVGRWQCQQPIFNTFVFSLIYRLLWGVAKIWHMILDMSVFMMLSFIFFFAACKFQNTYVHVILFSVIFLLNVYFPVLHTH